jgi:hypothetical protein
MPNDFEIVSVTVDEIELSDILSPKADPEDERVIRALEMQEALEEQERTPLILSASCSVRT